MDDVSETTTGETTAQAMARRYQEVLTGGEGSVLPSDACRAVAAEFGSDADTVVLAVAATLLAGKGMGTRQDEVLGRTVLIVEGHSSLNDVVMHAMAAQTRGIGIVVVGDRRPSGAIDIDVGTCGLDDGFLDDGMLPVGGDMFERPLRDGDVLDRLFSDPPHRGLMVVKHRDRGPDPCEVEAFDDRRDRPNWQSPYGPARGGRKGRGR